MPVGKCGFSGCNLSLFIGFLLTEGGGGHWLFRLEWRPAGLSVCLPFVNLLLHHKVQKFSSDTGSPGWSRRKGRKTLVCVYSIFMADSQISPISPMLCFYRLPL